MKTVRIRLDNLTARIDPDTDDDTLEILSDYWSYSHPKAQYIASFRHRQWDGRIRLMRRYQVPAGLFRATFRELGREHGINFIVTLMSWPVVKVHRGLPPAVAPYEFQNECVDAMVKAASRGGGIVLSATGTGKTATAARFFAKLDCPCLFVVDQLDLLNQNRKELESWLGEPVGMIGESRYEPERVTVATVQTLALHVDDPKFARWYNAVRIVVVDELHDQMNHRNFTVLHRIKPVARYGLTATLQMKQKPVRLRAWAFAGPVIFEFPVAEAMDEGVLTRGRVLQIRFPALTDVNADYQEAYAEDVCENSAKLKFIRMATQYAVEELGKHMVILVERVSRPTHLKYVVRAVKEIPHLVAYGKIDPYDRRIARKRFEKGKENLLIANKVFKKGVNIKIVDFMLDAAEMKSKNDALQKFGRGVRLHSGKDELLYLDIGTHGPAGHRFLTAARSRLKAFKTAGISVRRVNVQTAQEALEALKKWMSPQSKRKPTQTRLF